MNRTRIVTLAATALAMASLAACSQGGTVAGRASVDVETAAAQQAEQTEQARAAAAPAVESVASIIAAQQPQLGGIVTDGTGRTLYRFDKDTARPSKSNCDGDCATAWPPVLTRGEDVQVQGVDQALVGTVVRSDGSRQVTIAGWPLYTFSKDTGPGDINGQGAGGNWFAATPQGKKATGEPTNVVSLSVMTVAQLGDIVTDREGMTLYRFDNDTARPSKSTCDGDCALAWPPVLTESENVQVQGVDPALVGTVVRSDGSRQVTIAGWPVYRFAKDQVPCDTKGHAVGGVWFVITPQGTKAGA
jgi:predicted lipoprotein with Yx(FWY)xxD motif